MIKNYSRLTDYLLAVCNKDIPSNQNLLYLSRDWQEYKLALGDDILVPTQSNLSPTLPDLTQINCSASSLSSATLSSTCSTSSATDTTTGAFSPFPVAAPCIFAILDEVTVLSSLQKPRKITMIGSDGNEYTYLCKPKDDLRKDCRMMEFSSMINKFLLRDPESRRRQLRIRTYAVVPLNEECGLIEWVRNTEGYRNIMNKIYKARGMSTSSAKIKDAMNPRKGGSEKKHIFIHTLLPRFPPFFPDWFLANFPDPIAWYASRLSYARTAAVMSIVGYIVGLGDRHGENILFDSTTGEAVHCDFNCLFQRGKTFETPELVPFRLTHNMVAALGTTGYEGVFRKTCEVTLRILRDETDALMSILKTFIYDPLVEWNITPTKLRTANLTQAEMNQAVTTVNAILHRLEGKDASSSLPLSIEGQVDELLLIATNVDNLCRMYMGWQPFM